MLLDAQLHAQNVPLDPLYGIRERRARARCLVRLRLCPGVARIPIDDRKLAFQVNPLALLAQQLPRAGAGHRVFRDEIDFVDFYRVPFRDHSQYLARELRVCPPGRYVVGFLNDDYPLRVPNVTREHDGR